MASERPSFKKAKPTSSSSMPPPMPPPRQTVPPMAPPPVPPPRKISIAIPNKKRSRDADSMLGELIDAADDKPRPKGPRGDKDEAPTKKARRSPEKQSMPPPKHKSTDLDAYLDELSAPGPGPVPAPAPPPPVPGALPAAALPIAGSSSVPPPSPFANAEAPSLGAANIPFRAKRAKALLAVLRNDPSAVWVSTLRIARTLEVADFRL